MLSFYANGYQTQYLKFQIWIWEQLPWWNLIPENKVKKVTPSTSTQRAASQC